MYGYGYGHRDAECDCPGGSYGHGIGFPDLYYYECYAHGRFYYFRSYFHLDGAWQLHGYRG